ncbi:MAG: hypothetical protein SVS85_04280, partial [Candidatus Nanohaloarchaea archaeon]|nr:hypothetical protein [Candidatus Nanohaloarchaea archaeon]
MPELPFTQSLTKRFKKTDEGKDPVPEEDELKKELEENDVDSATAERLATMIEDGFKHSVQVGRQEAHLGETEEDNAVLYAVVATAMLSLVN